MSTTAKFHPSNILYRGECESFERAMKLVEAECDHEASLCSQYDGDEGRKLESSLASYKVAARRCAAEYFARVKSAADALAAEWKQSEDQNVRLIGEALESGDYSTLAI